MNFSLEEICRSDTAARLGIDNTPNDYRRGNINTYLIPGLEKIREMLGCPLYITSGYRSPELNRHIPGSSDTSAHTFGYAADFITKAFTPWEVCQKISMSGLEYDQMIYEYGQWTHISFDPRKRGINMTKLSGQPYRNGLHKE